MGFYDEMVKISNEVRNNSKLVGQIKDKIRLKAMDGEYTADRVYRLNGEYKKSINFNSVLSDHPILTPETDIVFNSVDRTVINEFTKMGFSLFYTLVNENPNPEFGQEGLKLGVYLSISWKQ